jgi:hypothetical protein
VTFGGAYSVLAYLAQQAVQTYGWLLPGEMLDGLGMAETTPGPLIQVVQFVAFMGAYSNPGALDPWVAGVLDALAVGLTEREEQRAEVGARAAGPRTTALVLVGLPLVGVAMSAALGGSPLVFLFTTPLGLLCLVLGVLLDVLGAWWTLRMVRGAVS